jgi:crotonobetainyl-CoA:carnitine CoA-transferase CaiB-like acyl-CoA transferase
VLVENFRPGVMARFGLDAAALRAEHPGLVYASISAYGAGTSMSGRPGLDPVLQAESGMMALTGEPDGPPLRTALSLIDTLTGAQATAAICAALLGRARNGRGDRLDLCLLDTAVAALGNAATQYLALGTVPTRVGNRHLTGTPTNLYRTATDPIYLAAPSDRLFRRLCREVLERPELVEDARFATPAARAANRDALERELEATLRQHPAEHWLARMHEIPAGLVRTLDRALASPEVAERGLVREVADAGGTLRVLGSTFRFAEQPLAAFRAPPHLGEHTREVLRDVLGYADVQVDALLAEGVVRASRAAGGA